MKVVHPREKLAAALVALVTAGGCAPKDPAEASATGPGTSTGADSTSTGTDGVSSSSSSTGGATTGDETTTSATEETTSATGETTTSTTGETTGVPEPGACGYEAAPVQGLSGEQGVALDLDGDGVLDLVTRIPEGLVRVHFGSGGGTAFTAGSEHSVGGGAKIAGGDFDGDGDPDLIAYDFYFDEVVRVLPNVGGDFGAAIETPMEALYYTFRVVDVDGDGDDDLSEGGYHSMPVRVFHAEAGQFTEAAQLPVAACYATASDWADLDGDGDLDFAVIGDCNAVLGMPYVTVHLREGDGYVAIDAAAQAASSDTFALWAGDFDGDGRLDLVTQGYREEPAFELHRGAGDGTFAPREEVAVQANEQVVRALDADGDGVDDVLSEGEGVVLYRGTAQGFERCVVGAGVLVEVGDFDGDGDPDLLLRDGATFTLMRRS